MSLGLGVLLSTMVLIAAWQLDRRGAWRNAGKVLLWVAGAAAIIGASAVIYFGWWQDLKAKRAHAAEVTRIRSPVGLAYWGLVPGMSKADVKYRKGDPTETEVTGKYGAPETWVYRQMREKSWGEYAVYWSSAPVRVMGIACVGGSREDCEPLIGLGIGTTESQVRETLGAPTIDTPPDDSGRKTIAYKAGADSVDFIFERGVLTHIARVRKEGETLQK